MARGSNDSLILEYTPEALSDLDGIWDWNAATYGIAHADRYIEFLQKQTDRLRQHIQGRSVPTRPDFKYVTIKPRRKGHGHIVVYEIVEHRIRVLRYFHTSQDWQNKMIEKT